MSIYELAILHVSVTALVLTCCLLLRMWRGELWFRVELGHFAVEGRGLLGGHDARGRRLILDASLLGRQAVIVDGLSAAAGAASVAPRPLPAPLA